MSPASNRSAAWSLHASSSDTDDGSPSPRRSSLVPAFDVWLRPDHGADGFGNAVSKPSDGRRRHVRARQLDRGDHTNGCETRSTLHPECARCRRVVLGTANRSSRSSSKVSHSARMPAAPTRRRNIRSRTGASCARSPRPRLIRPLASSSPPPASTRALTSERSGASETTSPSRSSSDQRAVTRTASGTARTVSKPPPERARGCAWHRAGGAVESAASRRSRQRNGAAA